MTYDYKYLAKSLVIFMAKVLERRHHLRELGVMKICKKRGKGLSNKLRNHWWISLWKMFELNCKMRLEMRFKLKWRNKLIKNLML